MRITIIKSFLWLIFFFRIDIWKFRVHFPQDFIFTTTIVRKQVKQGNAIVKKKGLIFLCHIAKENLLSLCMIYDFHFDDLLTKQSLSAPPLVTTQIAASVFGRGWALQRPPSCLDGNSRGRDADYILTVEFRTLYKSFVFVVVVKSNTYLYKSILQPKKFLNIEFMFTLTADLLGG